MTRSGIVAALALVLCARAAGGQFLQPELRVDAIGPPPLSVEPGLGANVALGTYVRLGLGAGYDVIGREQRAGRRWRGDAIARVTLDPFRQQRWALAIGAGISYRGGATTALAAVAELDGPEVRGLSPALQLGVSGGVRAGLLLRRAVRGRR